jgi:hypothetical protein
MEGERGPMTNEREALVEQLRNVEALALGLHIAASDRGQQRPMTLTELGEVVVACGTAAVALASAPSAPPTLKMRDVIKARAAACRKCGGTGQYEVGAGKGGCPCPECIDLHLALLDDVAAPSAPQPTIDSEDDIHTGDDPRTDAAGEIAVMLDEIDRILEDPDVDDRAEAIEYVQSARKALEVVDAAIVGLVRGEPASQEEPTPTCKVRAAGKTDPPQDCDWPFCGCDPHADRVIDHLQERGMLVAGDGDTTPYNCFDTAHVPAPLMGEPIGRLVYEDGSPLSKPEASSEWEDSTQAYPQRFSVGERLERARKRLAEATDEDAE